MQGCPYCGRENEDASATCSECGTGLVPPRCTQPTPLPSSLRRNFVATALTLAALVLLAILAICFNGHRSKRVDTIDITGTTPFKEQVANSLMLLKTRSPQSYGVVTSYIGRILQAKHSGMAAYEAPPTLELNDRTAFYSVTWCASSIAHDSIHSKLYTDYRMRHPGDAYVPNEVWTGPDVERQCCEHQTRVLQQIGAPPSEISWPAQTNNRFWEVDYAKRNW